MTTEIIALRVTVAPANLEAAPAKSAYKPSPRGRIRSCVWQFPTGSNGKVHAVLEDREGQIIPVKGGDMALSNTVLPQTGLDIPIGGATPEIRLVAWADAGNAYSHVIDLIVHVETTEVP